MACVARRLWAGGRRRSWRGMTLIGASWAMVCMLAAESGFAAEGSQLSQLFYQLQVLQQEITTLRGVVEEQAYQIEQLRASQQQQYRNVDQRLLELQQAAPSGEPRAPTAKASGTTSDGVPAGASSTSTDAPQTQEQRDYNAAYALIGERKYDDALRAFNRLIVDHPGGELTGNALYWLGELYLVQDEVERARAQFIQVLDLYPDHRKVPDTLFKLGVTYDRLGDSGKALEFLNRVRAEHPQHAAAGKAAEYAKAM